MILHKIKTILGIEPTCEEVNGFIVQYLDGTLDDRTRKKFLTHIRDCSTCSRFLEQYQATIELTREAGLISPPDELYDKTMAFLRRSWSDPTAGAD